MECKGTYVGEESGVRKVLLCNAFADCEDKVYEDAGFTFFDDNGTRVLKQERIAFAEQNTKQFAKKWDSPSNSWIDAGDAADREYSFALEEAVTDANMEINFYLKRDGGENQSFCIKPTGMTSEVAGIFFQPENLKFGPHGPVELKLTSGYAYPISLPQGEWCHVNMLYHVSSKGFCVSVLVRDESGEFVASSASTPVIQRETKIVGFDVIDESAKNLADFGKKSPENSTSVWYMKDFTVVVNPLKPGDRIKVTPTSFESAPGIRSQYICANGHPLVRPYFGRYGILPDKSGFICGTADRSIFLYEFATEELVYLDRGVLTPPSNLQMGTYVNPITGNVFYCKHDDHCCNVLYKINPKTFERTKLYESEIDNLHIFPEVSHDEKYVACMRGGWANANELTYFARINLETKEIEHEHSLTYDEPYCVNHLVINPVYPELLFFHREKRDNPNVMDQSNLLNFITGEIITHKQRGRYSGHAIWTFDGEHIACNIEYTNGDGFALLTKDMEEERWIRSTSAHPVIDESKTWVASDYVYGVRIQHLYDSKKDKFLCDLLRLYTKKSHPYHAHTDISKDGKLIVWGYTDSNWVLGVAWTTNPFLDQE